MIRLYDETETQFLNNGIKTLHPYKCEIYKEDGGDYYCEIEDSIENIEFYQNGRILFVDLPWGAQGFEIQDITPKNNKIIGKFWHIYYKSNNYAIAESYVTNENIINAMTQLNNATDNTSPFSVFSDIDSIISYKCIRNSLNEAITELLNRSNGCLIRDNYNIKILSSIGEDRNVTLSYKKNIKEIEKNIYIKDWLCTKVLPVGKDGQLLDDIYVTSSTQYSQPYTKIVSFDQDIEEDDYTTNEEYISALKSDLQNQAESYLEEHSIPKVNFTVKAEIQNITDIGDTIYVKYEPLNINLTTQVIAIKYDAILGKYKEIQFGNFKNRLSNLVKSINQKIEAVDEKINPTSTLEKAKKTATELINHPFNGYIYINENTGEMYLMDTNDISTAQSIWKFGLGGIGYSSTGINGTYQTAITQDGKIVADFITTGVLDGELIKAGSIGATQIDTSIFQSGGSNIIINSSGIYENGWENMFPTYTDDDIKKNTLAQKCFFVGNGTQSQTRQKQNGTYTISWKYKKIINLANVKLKINGVEFNLDSTDWTTNTYTFSINSNTIQIEVIGDTTNCCYLADIMCVVGVVPSVWSSAPGESTNGGVSISDRIEITDTKNDVKHIMGSDSDKYESTLTGATIGQWTDKGLDTENINSKSATIAGQVIKKIGNQVTRTVVG